MSEETPTAFDAAAATDEDLRAEYSRIRARGQELSAIDNADMTEEQRVELTELGNQVDGVQSEINRRTQAAETAKASRDKFAALPELTVPVVEEPAPVVEETAPVVEEPVVTASVPSVKTLAPKTPAEVAPERSVSEFSIRLTNDGASVLGADQSKDTDVSTVARAVVQAFGQYGRSGGGISSKRSVAQFSRNRGDEFQLTKDRENDHAVLARLGRENRLDGGSLLNAWRNQVDKGSSLTAAAGWCAPSETLYDLCSLWSMDGMIDLPTATARRGGFVYTDQPSYAELEASTSFTVLTEAQVIADTPKNCAELPCPTFDEVRLDVAVTCITASFLQSAGYPELVNTWVDGLLTNHAHKLNEILIARMVTAAGAANVIPGPAGGGADGATASLLAALELAATDMRYRERMAFSQTFEVVLPEWTLAQIRADLSRRNGYPDNPFNITNQMIASWFAVRGIRPQFVYDWQDALSGLAAGPGGATDLTALPTDVNFLIYPAGAVVLARQDVVTLSNVYDAANLTQNLYTRLFSEEGFALMFPCGEIRQYTVDLCPSGATGAQVDLGCVAPEAG